MLLRIGQLHEKRKAVIGMTALTVEMGARGLVRALADLHECKDSCPHPEEKQHRGKEEEVADASMVPCVCGDHFS